MAHSLFCRSGKHDRLTGYLNRVSIILKRNFVFLHAPIGHLKKYLRKNLLKLVTFTFWGTKVRSDRSQLLFILNETSLQVLTLLTARNS